MLFSDNADYHDMHDFIHGVLVDEELHGNSLYLQVCTSGYASRVLNPRQYDAMSRDLLRRWIHPIIPDKIFDFIHRRSNIYLHRNHAVELLHNTHMEKNVIVGESTTIGLNCVIKDSVIGANCSIGNDVKLNGAYVWDNVTIEDGCNLTSCIIAHDVKLRKNTTIKTGCVIGEHVVLGPNVTLEACTLIQKEPLHKGDKVDHNLVGKEGQGYRYVDSEDSDEEAEPVSVEIWGQPDKPVHDDGWSSSDAEDSGSDGEFNVDDDTKSKLF